MTPPSVSVVIAVYNGEKYLAQAIESALAQSFPPSEIIVIDDGSKDGTPAVIESYKKRGVVVSRRVEPNAGVANAMSAGMAMATGKYIAFLDHDDVWFRDKLKKQVEAMERYPEAGLACCNFAHRPESLRRRVFHFSKLNFGRHFDFENLILREPFLTMVRESIIGTSSVVFLKRSVAEQVGSFNRKYRVSGDYDYWMRCSLVAPFVVLKDVLLYKRTTATNISADRVFTFTEYRQILRELPLEIQKTGGNKRWEALCRQEAAKISYMLGNLCFERGERARTFEFFDQGLRESKTLANLFAYGTLTLKKRIRCLHG